MNDLTSKERKRLMECMQDDKFMELLADYAKEISDPNNRKETEEYLRQIENEQGSVEREGAQIMIPDAVSILVVVVVVVITL
jgi:dynein assembly factor 2